MDVYKKSKKSSIIIGVLAGYKTKKLLKQEQFVTAKGFEPPTLRAEI